ncbi:hypothetical protein STP4a_069 [Salmonella phage STP4-a]|uniref:Uncharacterized protein n=1 Tax=Salmonella phage STP4-a TaxID=1445860 RepID=A0A0B4L982_9CAUD|nr:hypothetical protein STP4a_069 [Salmonella phage STP4-a]AHJ86924.1 hypothetical protein STP4a_069 [Salmonella phage STP4-a]
MMGIKFLGGSLLSRLKLKSETVRNGQGRIGSII